MNHNQYKVLLVDDDTSVLEFLSYNLKRKGFVVKTAMDGQEALDVSQEFRPDIIFLDWMMPVMDGLAACRALRQNAEFDGTIIAFLTAKDDTFSQIQAFEAGADDFVHKTIKPNVFVAKAESLLRRRKVSVRIETILELQDVKVYTSKRIVLKGGRKLELTKIEYQILVLLLKERDKVFSRQEIYQAIWGGDVIVGDRTLDVHIRNLRKKIGAHLIHTQKGVGYTIATAV